MGALGLLRAKALSQAPPPCRFASHGEVSAPWRFRYNANVYLIVHNPYRLNFVMTDNSPLHLPVQLRLCVGRFGQSKTMHRSQKRSHRIARRKLL
jgi:hypothetical protein